MCALGRRALFYHKIAYGRRAYPEKGNVRPDRALAHIIHEDFYCNHRYAATTSLTAGGFAAQSVNILMGTGALLLGACPRLRSGTGTAEDGGASPLASARPSRLACRRFRHELS